MQQKSEGEKMHPEMALNEASDRPRRNVAEPVTGQT